MADSITTLRYGNPRVVVNHLPDIWFLRSEGASKAGHRLSIGVTATDLSDLFVRVYGSAKRSRQGGLNAPATLQAKADHARSGSDVLRPFARGSGSSVERDGGVGARVLALFASCGPAAIVRRVRAVVVDALNRVLVGWSWPHIGQKSLKAIEPSSAHGDASAAVVLEPFVTGVYAALPCCRPHGIFRHQSVANFQAQGGSQSFNTKAATANGLPGLKVYAPDHGDLAAVASANPSAALSSSSRRGHIAIQHDEASESLARQITDYHPSIVTSGVSKRGR